MPKKGVVLPLGAAGESDNVRLYTPAVIYKDGFFYLFYSGYNGANYRICLALSKNGVNFIKKGVVLPLGAAGEADNVHAYTPSVIYKDGFFYLFYAGHDGTNSRICLALSKNGVNFV